MKAYIIENEDDFTSLMDDFSSIYGEYGLWFEGYKGEVCLSEIEYSKNVEVILLRDEISYATLYTKEAFFEGFLRNNIEDIQISYYKANPTFTFTEILAMRYWNNRICIRAKHDNFIQEGYITLGKFLTILTNEYNSADIHDILKTVKFYINPNDGGLLPED